MDLVEKILIVPIFHSLKGHVRATITEKEFEVEDDRVTRFRFKGIWEESYEAEQHVQHLGIADQPDLLYHFGLRKRGYVTSFR